MYNVFTVLNLPRFGTTPVANVLMFGYITKCNSGRSRTTVCVCGAMLLDLYYILASLLCSNINTSTFFSYLFNERFNANVEKHACSDTFYVFFRTDYYS